MLYMTKNLILGDFASCVLQNQGLISANVFNYVLQNQLCREGLGWVNCNVSSWFGPCAITGLLWLT